MTFAVTAISAASAVFGAYASYAQAQASKKIAQRNADVAGVEAQDALKRGEQNAIEARHRGQVIQGQQRAALSARGLNLSGGTPSDILAQADFFTEGDEATARTNGRKEAWARQSQSVNSQLSADAANPGLSLAGGLLSGAGGLLSGAGIVASKWYQPKG